MVYEMNTIGKSAFWLGVARLSSGLRLGEEPKGGHKGIPQRDLGIAFAVIRNVRKDVLNRAQPGIGTKMFSHFRHHQAHSNP